MDEAAVRLLCPECDKHWRTTPRALPPRDGTFDCPECEASHRLTEFLRTDHDLETLKQLQ